MASHREHLVIFGQRRQLTHWDLIVWPELHFGEGDPSLPDLGNFDWRVGESRIVEFFPGQNTRVTLYDISDPALPLILSFLDRSPHIAIDFEWFAFSKQPKVISVYQIASSQGVFVIRDLNKNAANPFFRDFLSSHSFVGKGNSEDLRHLRFRYGSDFRFSIEDIAETRLKPNNLSLNFQNFVSSFHCDPKANFKEKRVALSDWDRRVLTIEQVCYAAFDAFAIYCAFPNLPERRDAPASCFGSAQPQFRPTFCWQV